MAKGNWVKEAFAHMPKGTLHRKLHVPEGQKIPVAKLEAAVKKGGKLGHEAQLALNARHFHHGKKGK